MLEGERSAERSEQEVAFATFVEQRLLQQYRLATVILGDAVEAQDATHDAFELAWKRWDSLRDPGRLDAWFGRILINVCRDRLRRRRRVVTDISAELAETLAGPDAYRRTADRDEIGVEPEHVGVRLQVVVIGGGPRRQRLGDDLDFFVLVVGDEVIIILILGDGLPINRLEFNVRPVVLI